MGPIGRTKVTGYGCVHLMDELLWAQKINSKNVAIAIQGFGNVGYYFAELAYKYCYKIVAWSDSKGGIYSKQGIDPKAALQHKQKTRQLSILAGTKNITNEQLLLLDVTCLVPSALENVITKRNAKFRCQMC